MDIFERVTTLGVKRRIITFDAREVNDLSAGASF